jgi:hypothetical protein
VIPLGPAPDGFVAGRSYAPAELLALLADRARGRLAFDDEGEA